MSPLGIFGGTFDPIHNGHIQPIVDVCRRTGIREVRYIPSARPGHRRMPRTDEQHRLNMVALAIANIPGFVADDCEIRRPGKSFTVPTLRQYRREFRFRPLCLILGADAFAQIRRWYWWAEVLRLANIVVVNRLGSRVASTPVNDRRLLPSNAPQVIGRRVCGAVCRVDTKPIHVSSTDLRKRLSRGRDVAGLLPASVSEYVARNNLYLASGGNC